MDWIRANWRWAGLNLFAICVLIYVLTQGSTDFNSDTFDPGLENGKWAIRFLLICLAMTPLRIYFGWRSAIKLRKSAGLWCFGFAVVHIWFLIGDARFDWLSWLTLPVQPFITLGLIGIIILLALAVTSNRWAMRRLRKNWKRLHRLVYLAGMVVIFHGLLAINASKKMFRDPDASRDLSFYLGLLIILLLLRLPFIQRFYKRLLMLKQNRHKVDVIS